MRLRWPERRRKTFSERSLAMTGVIGTVVLVLILFAAFNFNSLPGVGSGTTYKAQFSEGGAISSGDDVLVAGRKVGTVTSVDLIDWQPAEHGAPAVAAHVEVAFKITEGGVRLGAGSRAKIITETVLGKAAIQVASAGATTMAAGETIPLSRTSAPYDITQALSQLTTTTSAIDTQGLVRAFATIAGQFKNTPTQLRAALVGVARVSQTISSRDAQLRQLLGNSASLTGLLASRNKQVTTLLQDGRSVLSVLNSRRQEITTLLVNAQAVAEQIHTLVTRSGADLKPALTQVTAAVALLNRNKINLEKTIEGFLGYVGGLGGAISSGPYFDALAANLQEPLDLVPGVSALPCVLSNLNLSALLGVTPPDGCTP